MPGEGNPVTLAKDERLVRKYNILKVISPFRGQIHLFVTNKRLILYSGGETYTKMKQSSLTQQLWINEAKGVDSFNSKEYSRKTIITGALLAVVGFFLMISMPYYIQEYFSWLMAIGAVIFIFGVIMPKKKLNFMIKGVNGNLNIGECSEIKPIFSMGPDFELMLSEIGGLIIDLQNKVDIACEDDTGD